MNPRDPELSQLRTDITYAVIHNPNCPSPWMVRLPNGTLDYLPPRETRDFVGYGLTLEQAFERALFNKEMG